MSSCLPITIAPNGATMFVPRTVCPLLAGLTASEKLSRGGGGAAASQELKDGGDSGRLKEGMGRE